MKLAVLALIVWKVWWDDGSGLQLFHSDKHKWSDIPDRPGMQVVLVCEDKEYKPGFPYRRMLRGADWYGLIDGEPVISRGDGADNGRLSPRPDWPHPRAGKTIPDETYNRYHEAAFEDKQCSAP